MTDPHTSDVEAELRRRGDLRSRTPLTRLWRLLWPLLWRLAGVVAVAGGLVLLGPSPAWEDVLSLLGALFAGAWLLVSLEEP